MRKIAALNEPDPKTGEIKSAASYSGWESGFLNEIEQRLNEYGSAFHDLSKGRAEEALSLLQDAKLKEIAAKARGKARKPLSARKPMRPKRHGRSHDGAD